MENDRVATLGLSASGLSPEELFETWQGLLWLRLRADDYLAQMRSRFERAEDPVERDRLWSRLEALWSSYQVLSAWIDATHAAFVFATEGSTSVFMDDAFFTFAGTVTPPD